MADEDRDSQREFVCEYVRDFNPIGTAEITLARNIAIDYWRRNRMKAVEENILALIYMANTIQTNDNSKDVIVRPGFASEVLDCECGDGEYEIVYFPDGREMTDNQLESRFSQVKEQIRQLTKEVAEQTQPEPQKWLQKRPILNMFLAALIGTVLCGSFLPFMVQHAIGDLNNKIDDRLESKLKSSHFDELRASVDKMSGQVERIAKDVDTLLSKSI